MYVHTHTQTHMHVFTNSPTDTHVQPIQIYINIYIICIYTYTHIHAHIYIYIYMYILRTHLNIHPQHIDTYPATHSQSIGSHKMDHTRTTTYIHKFIQTYSNVYALSSVTTTYLWLLYVYIKAAEILKMLRTQACYK
jgi:hypothetical protein